MGDAEAMAIIHCSDDLLEARQRLGRREPSARAEVVEQLSALDVLEDEVELGRGLPDVVETHDVGVFDELHDDDFALDAEEHVFGGVSGTGEGGAVEVLFGDDLDGGVLACFGVAGDTDAACGAMGDGVGVGGWRRCCRDLPELPLPMVLPTFQRPIILGSSSLRCFRGNLGYSPDMSRMFGEENKVSRNRGRSRRGK